jgi:hypothetical protein
MLFAGGSAAGAANGIVTPLKDGSLIILYFSVYAVIFSDSW